MLQFRRDLDLVEHLDKLGYDEFWCGEHHSSGWEMIGSPELFLAAAGERTKRIKLTTGVVPLPMSWHIAETRDQARAEAREGLLRHHNEYITATLQRPGARPYKTADEAVATIGTPDDLVERIKSVLEISGGFGAVVGFVHDWANPENTRRSWDMVARYVVPQLNGYLAGLRTSREFVADNREYFNRAREAVMAKITENPASAAALKVTKSPLLAASAGNVPDLDQASDRRASR